jgi:hypothetical protein
LKPLLLALLLAAACKHSTSSSSTSHTETQTVTDTQTSESGATTTTTTVTEQPGETTTTTEEFGPPEAGTGDRIRTDVPGSSTHASVPPGDRSAAAAPVDQDRARGRNIPAHGPLIRRTVTVTKHGGETTQSRTEATQTAQGATETKAAGTTDTQAQAQTASAPSAGCVGASWIWGLAVLVGVLGVLYGVIRFRRAVP